MNCLARRPVWVCLILFLASLPAAGGQRQQGDVQLPDDVAFIANGLQHMLDHRLQQATGTGYTCYQERDPASGKTVFDRTQKFDFFLDGEKIRWDQWNRRAEALGGYALQHKHAFNGDVVSEFMYTEDGLPTPAAHIRSREWLITSDKRTFTGTAFNPRYLYVPQEFVHLDKNITEWLREWIQYGGEVRVAGDIGSGTVVDLCVIRRKTNPHTGQEVKMELRTSVDIAAQFLARKSTYMVDDQVVAEESYEYQEDPGSKELVLTKWVKERYVPGNRRPSTQTIDVQYASVNQSISTETFTLAGFDLPLGMNIVDTRYALEYKYGGADYADEMLNNKLAYLEKQGLIETPVTSRQQGDSSRLVDGGASSGEHPTPPGRATQAHGRQSGAGRAVLPMVLGSLLVGVLGVALVQVRRKRRRCDARSSE